MTDTYEMTPLCHLARKYETDKGGQHFRYGGGDSDTNHAYTPHYHRLFGDARLDVRHVLEVGVHAGSSLRMWKEYFPVAQIVGFDTNAECLKHAEERITVLMADGNNPRSMHEALAKLPPDRPPFDLIVEDASHERDHQVTAIKTLLPFLAPWGYMVIEDIGRGPGVNLMPLIEAVPPAYLHETVIVEGGWGAKVLPYEYLFVVRHRS